MQPARLTLGGIPGAGLAGIPRATVALRPLSEAASAGGLLLLVAPAGAAYRGGMASSASPVGRSTEPELTSPVDLCTAAGRLNRAAVGFTRRPLHRCNLSGHWGRKKRWDYWAVTTDACLLSVTYANLDYLGLVVAQFLDFASGRLQERMLYLPLAPGFAQPQCVAGSDIVFSGLGLRVAIREQADGTRVQASFRTGSGVAVRADVLVTLPSGHETLGVVIPWNDSLFQYTSKHNTRPAHGSVVVDGRIYRFDDSTHAYGCLDFGRGIWPYDIVWNWASASGVQDGHVVGLQLGGQWTDGTGMNENALCIDGRLHKLTDLDFHYDRSDFTAPWRICTRDSARVELTFTPFFERAGSVDLGLACTQIHQLFGRFSGSVRDDDGHRLVIRDLVGWAEEHRARW